MFASFSASTVMPNGSLSFVGLLPAQAEEAAGRSMPMLRHVVAEVLLDHGDGEDVVAGRHRRVRREAGAGLHRLGGRRRSRSFVLFHQHADALEAAERGVPFVHVADGRALADGPQGANAADAEDDLLLDARVRGRRRRAGP